LALAPVAMITERPRYGSSLPSAVMRNGRCEKSTAITSRAIISVPNRLAWASNFSIISGPRIPSS
jgi:hypothetical protein